MSFAPATWAAWRMHESNAKIEHLRNVLLRQLIGGRARYQGRVYEIVEVLEDGPALVLQSDADNTIQADQLGEAHRRVPQTVEVPLPLTETGAVDIENLDLELLDVDG